jgi:hypothetical protein
MKNPIFRLLERPLFYPKFDIIYVAFIFVKKITDNTSVKFVEVGLEYQSKLIINGWL